MMRTLIRLRHNSSSEKAWWFPSCVTGVHREPPTRSLHGGWKSPGSECVPGRSMMWRAGGAALALLLTLVLLHPPSARAQGALAEDPRSLAALPHAAPYRAFLPPEIDLSEGFPPPGDQGEAPTCTGWAVGYALRSYLEHRRAGSDVTQSGNRFNPVFVYNRVAPSCSSGARLSDAMGFISQVGALPLRDYASLDCPDDAGAGLLERAAQYRVEGYKVVRSDRPDDVKGQLAAGQPVVFAIRDTRALHRLGDGEIYESSPNETIGSHAMVVVGYDDSRQSFKMINSWGRSWASQGFGWISYAAFAQDVSAAFAASATVPRPAPRPPAPVVVAPPPPPPVPIMRPSPLESLRERVATLSTDLSCGRLRVSANGEVVGFVSSEADLARVRRAADGARVESVNVRPWPQCEVLLTLERSLAGADGMSLALEPAGRACRAGLLCEGDPLVATIRLPRRPSYLYVAYIQAAGDTLILAQPKGDVPRPYQASENLVLGRGAGQADMRIAGPFGREMLIAVASGSPLFDRQLPDQMTEREFLTMLRRALLYKPRPTDADRVVAATVLPIVTARR